MDELRAEGVQGQELVVAENVLAAALERVRLLAAEKEEVAKAQARVDELRAEGVHGQKLVVAERALADALERVQIRQLTEQALKEIESQVGELIAGDEHGDQLVAAERALADELERVQVRKLQERALKERAAADAETERLKEQYDAQLGAEILHLEGLAGEEQSARDVANEATTLWLTETAERERRHRDAENALVEQDFQDDLERLRKTDRERQADAGGGAGGDRQAAGVLRRALRGRGGSAWHDVR